LRTCVFDLETFSLHANTGILLCAVIKEVGRHSPIVIRADEFKEWRTDRTNVRPVVNKIIDVLLNHPGDGCNGFDIFVAHNGQYFDKALLNTWALKFNLPIALRFSRFIDPVLLLRRHCRLNRNSLNEAIDFFNIPYKKTPISWQHWMNAALNGDRDSLGYIVDHCKADVMALESLYNIAKRLVKGIDEKGSSA